MSLMGTDRDISEHAQAVRALRESEERFRAFVLASSDVVYRMSPDWSVMRELRGREFIADTEEPSGTWLEKYIHPDDQPHVMATIREAIRTKSVFQLEHRVLRVDGSLGWTFSRAIPLLDASGEIVEWFGAASDVTARRQAEEALRESEERFRLLVQGVKDCAIYMLAPDGTVRSWSAAAEEIFGYLEEEIVGQHRSVFFTEEDRRAGEPWRELERAATHGHFEHEAWRVRKDGSPFWANVLITALRDEAGTLRGFASVQRNFTERKKSETALRESEALLRLAQQVARTGSFSWDLRSGVNTWTPELEALYGLPPGSFDGTEAAFERLIHPDDRAQIVRWVERAIETGAPGEGEWRAIWPDGSVHWMVGRWQVIRDASGTPVRLTGINQDITQRKTVELAQRAQEAELELILGRTPFMLARVSRDLRYRYVSAAYARMARRTPEELAGRPMLEVLGEEGLATIRPYVEAVLRGETVEYEQEVHFVAVGPRRLQAMYVPDRDERGEIIGWIANIVDVTEGRQAEALRLANAQLVDADQRRTEFLGMLSHELRNPLAPIRNSLYLLDHSDPTGQEAHRARDVINRQVGHLTRLVDDLLDVTRITRGKVELRRVELDVGALVRRTADDYRRMMQDRGLDLAVEVGDGAVLVDVDETRLAQVFGNLLSNAAKFTPAGGRVTIAVRAEEGSAVVRVRDTGPGIAPELLPSIFEPFTQAKQTLARTEGGLGLGLALVRGLVSLHGGEVKAASEHGGGAVFVVTLPLAAGRGRRAPPPAAPASAPAPVFHHHRVLVVEDNHDAAETLAEMIRMLGHDVAVAYDGRTAVTRAGEYHPDLVLCDIGLPGMDGYEVARQLRVLGAAHAVRLIALSGYAQPEDVARAADAGFDAHLAKPCGPEQIERLLS
jgi:PAS domain S-box-containing protein